MAEKQITFGEMVDNTIQKVDSLYKGEVFHPTLLKIESVLSLLDTENGNGKLFGQYTIDELSRIAGSLAVYRSNLIDALSFAHKNIAIINAQLKIRTSMVRETTKKIFEQNEKKHTKTDIETEVDNKLARFVLELNLHENWYKKLTNYWFHIADVINRIDQRIKVMIGDKGTSKFYATDDIVIDSPYDLTNIKNE